MLAVFIPSIGVGFAEELAFRGYVFQTLAERGPVWLAAVLSSVIFAGMHAPQFGFGIGFFVADVALALVFQMLRNLSGSLWLPIGFHAAWDFTQTYVVGLATAGSGSRDPAVVPVSQTGPALWVGTGGLIEGGLIFLILIIFILTGLALSVRASGKLALKRAT